MSKHSILLVEDDDTVGYLLSEYLKMKDFEVVWAKNGQEGLNAIVNNHFDLCITDVMMPVMDGFTFAEHLHETKPSLPFIFLTARSMKIDALKGFKLGAVDYLRKPIDEEELVIRIERILENITPKEAAPITDSISLGKYTFIPEAFKLVIDNEEIMLTAKECKLLEHLVSHKNTLCSHQFILDTLWGKNDYFNRKSLNVFITRLRKYLSKDSSITINNVHNQGFILEVKA